MSYVKNIWNKGDTITYEKLNNMENGIEAAGESSGGCDEIAHVTITYDQTTNTTTCDKTLEELVEYMIAGKFIIGKLIIGKLIIGSMNLMMFISREGSGFTGRCIDPNNSNSEILSNYIFKLTKDGAEEVARVYLVTIIGYKIFG